MNKFETERPNQEALENQAEKYAIEAIDAVLGDEVKMAMLFEACRKDDKFSITKTLENEVLMQIIKDHELEGATEDEKEKVLSEYSHLDIEGMAWNACKERYDAAKDFE